MTNGEIIAGYKIIADYHEKFLKDKGVKLPSLYTSDSKTGFTHKALVLVFLAQGYPKTKPVTKSELTEFIRAYYPSTNDVQEGRHLGAQDGWWIVAGGRDNIVLDLDRGSYQLYTLEQPYPKFHGHRAMKSGDFESIKSDYGYRCSTCGSEEGKPHLHWPETETKLQEGHMDPSKPLEPGNIIPQCQKCNRGDRNRWIYDERGRVIKLADPAVIRSCSETVRRRVYEILKEEFGGK